MTGYSLTNPDTALSPISVGGGVALYPVENLTIVADTVWDLRTWGEGRGRISGGVATTSEAAKEIELSTQQQTSAVEQVNVGVSNVAQATREAEAAAGQTLQTAAQLATMSTELMRVVRAEAG